jgi:hypothetical protein
MTMTIHNVVTQPLPLAILSGVARRFFFLPQAGRDAEAKDLSSRDMRHRFS